MLEKIKLSPDDNLKPCNVEWSEEKEDYVITSFPEGLTRDLFVDLADEIKRITGWVD